MKLKQPVTINVVAEIVVRNVDTGEEVRYTTSNIMTNAGLAEIASHWVSPWQMPNGYGYVMEVGSGTGTPTANDTSMFSPLPQCFTYTSPTITANQVQFSVAYLPSQCNGYTFQEAGIAFPAQIANQGQANASVTGTLVDHLVFPTAINKTASIYLQIIITFIIV